MRAGNVRLILVLFAAAALCLLSGVAEAARDVIATLKAFPGALVEGVEEITPPAGAQA